MNILLLSKTGAGLGLADRFQTEGHEVTIYAPKLDPRELSRFKISNRLNLALKETRMVIADTPDWAHVSKQALMYNRPLLGSTVITEMINADHCKKYDLFSKLGIKTYETQEFLDIGDAYETLFKSPRMQLLIRYDDKTFECNYRDWISWAMSKIPLGKKILFQTPVKGTQFDITGWFNGFEFLDIFSVSPSPNVGEFSMSRPIDGGTYLIKDTIKKLGPFLRKYEYRGPVHLTMIGKPGKVIVIDMFFGFHYPHTYTMTDFVKEDLSNFFYRMISPATNDTISKTTGFIAAISARCNGDEITGAPVIGLNPQRRKHIMFHYIEEMDDNFLVVKDKDIVFTSVAFGETPQEASSRMYDTAKNLKFPEKHLDSSLMSYVGPMYNSILEMGVD